MVKEFENIEEFISVAGKISIDGSAVINMQGGENSVNPDKQYPFLKEAETMSLEDVLKKMPTALRCKLITDSDCGYEYLMKDLNCYGIIIYHIVKVVFYQKILTLNKSI